MAVLDALPSDVAWSMFSIVTGFLMLFGYLEYHTSTSSLCGSPGPVSHPLSLITTTCEPFCGWFDPRALPSP